MNGRLVMLGRRYCQYYWIWPTENCDGPLVNRLGRIVTAVHATTMPANVMDAADEPPVAAAVAATGAAGVHEILDTRSGAEKNCAAFDKVEGIAQSQSLK